MYDLIYGAINMNNNKYQTKWINKQCCLVEQSYTKVEKQIDSVKLSKLFHNESILNVYSLIEQSFKADAGFTVVYDKLEQYYSNVHQHINDELSLRYNNIAMVLKASEDSSGYIIIKTSGDVVIVSSFFNSQNEKYMLLNNKAFRIVGTIQAK